MNSDLFLSTLGLARRANKLCYGFESVAENGGNARMVFVASDSSERTKKSLSNILSYYNIACVSVKYTKSELGHAIGTKPVGIISVTDIGFAKLLKSRLPKEETE